MNKNKKTAFTLVELLIAMFIFAMLAVLLIPNVSNTAEKELFATQLKKVQNDIQQAVILMMSRNQGSLQAFCIGAGNGGECFTKEIGQRLEKKSEYGKGYTGRDPVSNTEREMNDIGDVFDPEACTEDGAVNSKEEVKCYQAVSYLLRKPQTINKTSVNTNTHPQARGDYFYVINLANGAAISTVFNSACNYNNLADDVEGHNRLEDLTVPTGAGYKVCGYIEVDINAGKAPNMLGKDIHYFWIIDRDGIVPFGEIDTYTCGRDNHVKDADNTLSDSFGCTAKLLREGKINYY